MSEMRWNPLIKDWVMIASNRQNRPLMPKEWCPFCPGSGKVPDDYEVYKYDNDFPSLSQEPAIPDVEQSDVFTAREAYGKCEVILYSSEHTTTLSELTVEHIKKLVDLWTERFIELQKDKRIKYVYIFENKGGAVGATISHPHGQIYGYPYVPKKLQLELEACKEHYISNNKCLICDIIEGEQQSGKRVIFENEDFIVFLPYFSECPYGIYVASKKHIQNLAQLDIAARFSLAKTIKEVIGTLDKLFGFTFPYMMCMHQEPVNGEDYSDYFHFHIEFFSPLRSANKQKYNASGETGAWAHVNPTLPEENAVVLRVAYRKFISTSK